MVDWRHTRWVSDCVQSSGEGLGLIADAVAQSLASAPYEAAVMASINGSQDPAKIAVQVVEALSSTGIREPVASCLFHVASVGSVTGVVLVDESQAVVKAYQPTWTAGFLSGVHDTQARLWRAGVPCGKPLGGPTRCGIGLATIETYVADPGQPEVFGDRERTASAQGLVLVIDSAGADARLADHPLSQPDTGLYPKPHNPVFDLDATSEGAEWTDELATLARTHRDDRATVVCCQPAYCPRSGRRHLERSRRAFKTSQSCRRSTRVRMPASER